MGQAHTFLKQNDFKLRRAFTLVEVLLVMTMLSMIGLALFNTFANGFKIWERHRKFVVEQDVLIFFEKINQDLRNTLVFSPIPFTGQEDSISFPTRIKTVREDTGGVIPQIGEVIYAFDPTSKKLTRRQGSYMQAVHGDLPQEQQILKYIDSVRFTYYYLEKNQIITSDSVKNLIPRTVLIEVTILDTQGHQRLLRKLINLPQGV